MIASLGIINPDNTIDAFLEMVHGENKKVHGDGWGALYQEEGMYSALRSPLSIWEDSLLEKVREKEVYLLHARNATKGEVKVENAHPFYRSHENKEWFFCHNGTVRDTLPSFTGLRGSTDSERFFRYLLSHIEVGNEMESLENSLRNLQNYSSTNFLLMDGEHVYINRAFKEKEKEFTLEVFEGDDVLLASSEPFEVPYSGVWTPLSNKELAKVDISSRKVVEKHHY